MKMLVSTLKLYRRLYFDSCQLVYFHWNILHNRCCFYSTVPSFDAKFVEKDEIRSYDDLLRLANLKPDRFWEIIASRSLQWQKNFTSVSDCDFERGAFKWFSDGKLNASVNCVDRHAATNPDGVALIWEKDEPGQEVFVTYKELLDMVCRLANVLKKYGVQRQDRVAIYMPVSPLGVAAMLACTRIGAIHSVIFAGFRDNALSLRLNDANAKVIITCDQAVRGGGRIELKSIVNRAVKQAPCVQTILMAQRTGEKSVERTDLDVALDEEMSKASHHCYPEAMNSEDYLFILYTSGSTGKPKGIAHSTGGYLTYASWTHRAVFNWKPGDIFGCMADIGWITGHTYGVYGPLCNGATSVLFESVPTYPNPGRYWEMVQRLGINQFYTAPTAIRLLLRSDDSWVTQYDRSALKTLGSVGEPINREAWDWYHNVVGRGRCEVVDTWWQTETGGIMVSPRPSVKGAHIEPAMAMRPLPGIDLAIINPQTLEEMSGGCRVEGALCIKTAWPGIARTIWGSHQRYLDTYLRVCPGMFYTGDEAVRDEQGHYRIIGRLDDVINVAGHRLGTAEVEEAIDHCEGVAESAVIGVPHSLRGEAIESYVILKECVTKTNAEMIKEINETVKSNLASFAVPEKIWIVPALPKTRSGKIMRRILKKLSMDNLDDLGDTSTLADPQVVETLVKLRATADKNQ